MTTKDFAIELIQSLPEETTFDEIIEELIVQKKIKIGLEQTEAGQTVPHEEVKRKFQL